MFVLEDRDSEELVLVLQGYFALLTERELTVNYIKSALDETREYPLVLLSRQLFFGHLPLIVLFYARHYRGYTQLFCLRLNSNWKKIHIMELFLDTIGKMIWNNFPMRYLSIH